MARKPEPKTQAVRQLLDKHPDLTWNPTADGQPSAKLLLKALGFTENAKNDASRITENDFNVKKHLYLNAQNERPGVPRKSVAKTIARVSLSNDTVITTISTVNKSGGLEAYRASLALKVQKLERLQERVAEISAEVSAMQSNIETFEQVQKAVA